MVGVICMQVGELSRCLTLLVFTTFLTLRLKHLPGTGNVRSMEFLRQCVSIEIQRGNAAAVMGTVENPKEWDGLFFVVLECIYFSILSFPSLWLA